MFQRLLQTRSRSVLQSGIIALIVAGLQIPVAALAQGSGRTSPTGEQGLTRILRAAVDVWKFKITAIRETPITVGTVVVFLLLLFAGYGVSRRLSRGLGGLCVRRFKMEPGQATAVQTLTFYLLFLAVVMTALRLVNFPLTAFTIAGGALAIGVGFGSQNLMNNFMSGLILLIERPVRVGDLLQIDGTVGTVEHIGARSTRILTAGNIHIIVPNSFLLQNNVVNYTLSDDVIRASVQVGIVYGSPTRKAEKIILDVLKEHPKILHQFEPRVMFSNFGDNALEFDIFFSIRARTVVERRQIESDVRFRIDDLFREAGIVIAFPQRDIHLDSSRPVDVRLLKEEPDVVSKESP